MKIKYTRIKRCTALALSLLLLAALLPSGVIAVAADNPEILSFEQGNPVAGVSCKTGDTVDPSDFPAELTAVVAATPQSFTQVKPEDMGAYIAPENADALYEAGTPVVYSFAGANGTESRVYGEADGVTGWYACNADGAITGSVEKIPVSWDISAVDCTAPGEYTVTGSAEGYRVLCDAPQAVIRVLAAEDRNAPEDGEANGAAAGNGPIRSLETYYQAGDAQLEDGQYVLTPERNYTDQNRESTLRYSVTYGVHFSLSGKEDYEPGTVVLRIPAKIFQDRDGTYKANASTIMPVPEVGQPNNTDFCYSYDSTTEEYVITNINRLTSACEATFHIKYVLLYPSVVKNGSFTRDYQVSLRISRADEQLGQANASAGNVRIDTKYSLKETKKSVYKKYEVFPSGWGEPTELDVDRNGDGITDDYFYVAYRIVTRVPNTNTQPCILKTEDFPETGEVVSYRPAREVGLGSGSDNHIVIGSKVSYTPPEYSIEIPNCQYYDTYYGTFVLVRYKRADLNPDDPSSYQLKNRAVSTLTGIDTQKPVTSEATITYKYTPPKPFSPPGGYASVDKSGSGDVAGGISMLQAGRDVTFASGSTFKNGAAISYYEKTYQEPEGLSTEEERLQARQDPANYGKRPVRAELVDDLFYFQDHYTEPLQPEDYELTTFSLGGISNYNNTFYKYERNTETGEFQLVAFYKESPDMELYIKSVGSDSWTQLGTFRDNNYWRFIYEDGTEINGQNRFNLPAGTVAVKLVTDSAFAESRISYSVGMKLHPTEHLLRLMEETTPGQVWTNGIYRDAYTIMDVNSLLIYDADGNMIPTRSNSSARPEYLTGAYARDEALYGQRVGHSTATMTISDFRRGTSMAKSLTSYENDTSNKEVRLHYRMYAGEFLYYGGSDTAKEIGDTGIVHEQRSGTFYDLLPKGCVLDAGTLKVTSYRSPYGTSEETLAAMDDYDVQVTYELEDNWHGTGRTMLTIHMETPEGVRTYPYKNGYYHNAFSDQRDIVSGFVATFDLTYPWDAVTDYGVSLLNSAAYRSGDGNLTEGRPDDGGTITDAALFRDMDGDGNPPGTAADYLYGEAKTKIDVVTSTELDLSKRVRAANGQWSDGLDGSVIVDAGEMYEYRLRMGSAKGTRTKNVILYDALEQYQPANGGSQWRGILTGVDLSQPIAKGVAPVVYYSTSSIFRDSRQLDIAENRDLTNTELWSTAYPSDPSAITAIAVDLRKDADGNDFVLPEQQTLNVVLQMKAPADTLKDALANAHAYNNIYLSDTTIDSQNTETPFVIHAEYTQVGLKPVENAYELPSTGGSGTAAIYFLGLSLFLFGLTGLRPRRKKG